MQETIQGYVEELFVLVENPKAAIDAQAIVHDIERVVLSEVHDDELGALLLQKSPLAISSPCCNRNAGIVASEL